MILSKKAIQSHLLILLVISGVMTVCILTVFRPFFTNDPQNCQPIDFEITKKCKTDEKVIFNIKNNGDSIIRFKLNNEISDDYIITLEEDKKEFSFATVKDSIVILPYLINAHTKQETGICKGKKADNKDGGVVEMLKNYNKYTNKGQVSIFVIIGIILVIVLLFLFVNSKYEIFESHDTKIKNQISQVVKDCIYDSTERGAFLLGFQGGYIEIPREIEANPFSYIDFGMKIPNWDVERGNIPTIESMQRELNRFIENESYSCIMNNLKSMEENAFDIEYDDRENFDVNARINDNNVVVETDYLIRFNEKNSDEILSVSDYLVRLDSLRLGDLYNLAVEIYNVESITNIFEELTIDQIHSANDYSTKESMPSGGMSLSCGKRFWTIPQLKQNLANLNNNNFKYLEFVGTYPKDDVLEVNLNNEVSSESYRDYYEKLYRYPLYNQKKSFEKYNVDVYMPSTEITSREGYFKEYPFREFDVKPRDGQLVESQVLEVDMGVDMPIPCIQLYHHIYSLDYDLIVKLTDYNEDGDKFYFQFPVRVEVHDNQAKEKPVSIIQTEEKEATVTNANYCNSTSKKYPLMVVAVDEDGNSIDDVNISYKCINLKCDMGTTEKPKYMGIERKYADSQLETKFPFCIGGTVIGEKEGYHIAKKRATTDESLLRRESYVGDNLIELEMTPLKSFDVDISTFLIKYRETGLGDRVESEDDGAIFISLESLGREFESTAIWPNEEGFMDKLEFLDDEDVAYNLSIIYVDEDNELRGLFELKNWTPEIHSGNHLSIMIPATNSKITEDSYLEFFEYMKSKREDSSYGVFFN